MEASTNNVNFNERIEFEDNDNEVSNSRLASAMDLKGRCADCWGPISGSQYKNGSWKCVECLDCGFSIEGDHASSEVELMRTEVASNIPRVRRGKPAVYRPNARFVFKLIPDMVRDVIKIDQRIKMNLRKKRERNRITRSDFRPGSAGYLYAQARTLLAGIESPPAKHLTLTPTKLRLDELQIDSITQSSDGDKLHVDGHVPLENRNSSERGLMATMGTTLVKMMTCAFSCELGLKAILITRMDGCARIHNLLDLFRELPEDCRNRLVADFSTIEEVLEASQESFGEWRYFQQSIGSTAIQALFDTERAFNLTKAARVIADECEVAGLDFQFHINTTTDVEFSQCKAETEQLIRATLEAGESSIPWDDVLKPN